MKRYKVAFCFVTLLAICFLSLCSNMYAQCNTDEHEGNYDLVISEEGIEADGATVAEGGAVPVGCEVTFEATVDGSSASFDYSSFTYDYKYTATGAETPSTVEGSVNYEQECSASFTWSTPGIKTVRLAVEDDAHHLSVEGDAYCTNGATFTVCVVDLDTLTITDYNKDSNKTGDMSDSVGSEAIYIGELGEENEFETTGDADVDIKLTWDPSSCVNPGITWEFDSGENWYSPSGLFYESGVDYPVSWSRSDGIESAVRESDLKARFELAENGSCTLNRDIKANVFGMRIKTDGTMPLSPVNGSNITFEVELFGDSGRPLKWYFRDEDDNLVQTLAGCVIDSAGKVTFSDATAYNQHIAANEGCDMLELVIRAVDEELDYSFVETTLDIGCSCLCNGSGEYDVCFASVHSRFKLGYLGDGRSAGEIRLDVDEASSQNSTPAQLYVKNSGSGLELLRSKDRSLRQVKAPQTLADIVVDNEFQYAINFYDIDDVSGTTDTNGYYIVPTNDAWFVSYIISNPSASTNDCDTLDVVEVREEHAVTNRYVYETNGVWTLIEGNGLRVTKRTSEWDASTNVLTKTTIIEDDSSNEVSRVERIFQQFDWGRSLIEVVTHSGTDQFTNSWTYYEDVAETNRYGRIKSIEQSGGSWQVFDYNASGLKSLEIYSYKDLPITINASEASSREYDYTLHAGEAEGLRPYNPRTIIEKVNGVVVSKMFHAYSTNATGGMVEITERAAGQSAAYGDAGNLRTTSSNLVYDVASSETFNVKKVVDSIGRITTTTSDHGTLITNGTPSSWTFTPSVTGVYTRVSTINGTTASPGGVSNKTQKSVSISNEKDWSVFSESYVYAGAGYDRINWRVNYHDKNGRVIRTEDSSGNISESTWGCCGKEYEKNASGIEKTYSYDALKRQEITTKEAGVTDITTSRVLDAAGRTLESTMAAGGLSLVSSNEFDLAGRRIKTVNKGLETIYIYSADGITNTTISPGPVTNVTVSYIDGRTKYTMKNGVIQQYNDYGVNADGSRWNKAYSGPNGTNSAAWSKTTTDILGRTIKTERPGFGGVILVTSNIYNTVGQLVKTTTSGRSDSLREHNELGEVIRSGLDVNGDGDLDLSGPDRVNESESFYEQDASNDWWRVSVSKVYASTNATATTNSIQKARLTGLGTSKSSESISIDINGNQTISKSSVDRATKTATRTVDYPDSTNDVVSVSVNGLSVSSTTKTGLIYTNTYDALERRIGSTDPRIGELKTHFNTIGQVDWTEDAASNRTWIVYSEETGRRIATTNSLGKVARREYYPDGQLMRTWGDTGYPVSYVYDEYNRRIAMNTYRGGAGWNGATWPVSPGTADITAWKYHEATGLLTNKLYADTNGVTYAYYSDGKLKTRDWARGITTTYTYTNTTGEMIKTDYSDSTPDIGYTYTRIGLQDTITDAQGIRTFGYNDKLQRASETIVANGITNIITRKYDVYGRSGGFALNDSYDLDYGFDNYGRFNQISASSVLYTGTNIFDYAYLANSDMISSVSSGSMTNSRAYEDHRNLLVEVKNVFGADTISQYDYLNDAIGRRVERLDQIIDFASTVTNDFSYNNRSEVIGAMMGTNEYAYLFDNIGNRQSATNNGVATTYEANKLNQYAEVVETVTNVPIHDLDGNMTSYKGWTFTWNGENRMIMASNATTVVECKYDYMGRRFSKAVDGAETTFIYNGWNMIQESSSSETNHYVWGLDLSGSMQGAGGIGGLLTRSSSSTNVVAYYCFDGNGNVGQLVDISDGTVLAKYTYGPFGNTLPSTGVLAEDNVYRFSTKYFDDETELSYYGYRYYDAELGRWLNRDPIGEEVFFSRHSAGENIREKRKLRWEMKNAASYRFSTNDLFNKTDAFGLYTVKNCTLVMFYGHGDTDYLSKVKFKGCSGATVVSCQSNISSTYLTGLILGFVGTDADVEIGGGVAVSPVVDSGPLYIANLAAMKAYAKNMLKCCCTEVKLKKKCVGNLWECATTIFGPAGLPTTVTEED